jgi:hypothetical protein
MKKEINFLVGQRASLEKKAEISRMAKTGSFIVLIAYLLIVGALFSYYFYLNNQIKKTDLQITQKENKIEDSKEIESLQVLLKQRLSSLNKFFKNDKRPDFVSFLSFFEDIPAGVKIRNLTVATTAELTVSGESSNVVVLGEFLDKFKEEKASSLFSEVTLSTLDRQTSGIYLFVVSLKPRGNV